MAKVNGRKFYTLLCQVKPCSLDRAGTIKLKRFGFPIVPDFGGTAHAYCGSTLPAAIGDCLSWDERPRREDMLRSYIIKSRVRQAENILIVQPYSPHLFRQGMLPGPQLLLEALLKRKTTTELQVMHLLYVFPCILIWMYPGISPSMISDCDRKYLCELYGHVMHAFEST